VIVIAAGGTGGHLFPAEALAAALLARGERVALLTDARSSAAKSDVFAKCEVFVIPGAGVAGRSMRRALSGLVEIARGVVKAHAILARILPSVVVGFGGYPAVAPVLAARFLLRRPVLILHDQNAVLGKANAFLARFVDVIATSFANTAGLPGGRETVLTGNPVRPQIVAQVNADYPALTGTIHVLVVGGSLGAASFAALIPDALARLPAALRARIALTMQCPVQVIDAARAALAGAGVVAEISPFLQNMAELLTQAHIVVSRSGGSTVAELAVVGRPALLIPLRINADQLANAQVLVDAGAALLPDADAAGLAAGLQKLLEQPEYLKNMAAKAAALGIADAAERLCDLVVARKAVLS
jgi:UDP-N-acetylglucosamine--N-acetylmuramyl-(pentapeptide) pyrophosphoryl-undecaprenol N-acetylglucosamine transferase